MIGTECLKHHSLHFRNFRESFGDDGQHGVSVLIVQNICVSVVVWIYRGPLETKLGISSSSLEYISIHIWGHWLIYHLHLVSAVAQCSWSWVTGRVKVWKSCFLDLQWNAMLRVEFWTSLSTHPHYIEASGWLWRSRGQARWWGGGVRLHYGVIHWKWIERKL